MQSSYYGQRQTEPGFSLGPLKRQIRGTSVMCEQHHSVLVLHSIWTICIVSEEEASKSTSCIHLPEKFHNSFNCQGRGKNTVSWTLFQWWASEPAHLFSQMNVEPKLVKKSFRDFLNRKSELLTWKQESLLYVLRLLPDNTNRRNF